MTEIVNVTITSPDAETLVEMVRSLVDERLVAAGNITEGVHSIYRWNETIESATEASASLRTQACHVKAIVERVTDGHPYQVPQVVAVAIVDSNPEYRQWVIDATNIGSIGTG